MLEIATQTAEAPLRVQTHAIRRGSLSLLEPGNLHVLADGNEISVERGPIREAFGSYAVAIQQYWTFSTEPAGYGDLTVEVRIEGASFKERAADGHRFVDERGNEYGYSDAEWIDAAGLRTRVKGVWNGTAIAFRVSEEVVSRSAFPAVLDPLVGPSWGSNAFYKAAPPFHQRRPVAATHNNTYYFAHEDERGGVWVLRDMGPPGDIQVTPSQAERPTIADFGSWTLLAWQEPDGIHAKRLDDGLASPDGLGVAVAVGAIPRRAAAVATTGSVGLIVWEDERNAGTSGIDVYAARIDDNGTVLDPSGILMTGLAGDETRPAVSSDGSQFLVVWEDRRAVATTGVDIYATRVSTSGAVLDSGGIVIVQGAGDQTAPSTGFVATPTATHLVAWTDTRNAATSGTDIYAARVSTTGVVQDAGGFVVATASGDQTESTVAGVDSDELWVGWQDRRNGVDDDVYAARVDTSGTVLDPDGELIAGNYGNEASIAITPYNGGAAIAWQLDPGDRAHSATYYAIPYTEPASNAVGLSMVWEESQLHGALASSGSEYLLLWRDEGVFMFSGYDIRATRYSTTGQNLGIPDGFVVSDAPHTQDHPDVAWSGSQYLAVWEDRRGDGQTSFIYCTRLSVTGQALDPDGIPISPSRGRRPRVAGNGTDFLVVWEDDQTLGDTNLLARRVSASGTLLDTSTIPIATANRDQTRARVASDGAGYVVFWTDDRNGAGTPDLDVYARRVSSGGVAGSEQLVAGETGDQDAQSIVWSGTSFLAVWKSATSIRGQRFDSALGPVGATITISDQPATDEAASSMLGSSFVVLWTRDGSTKQSRATRVGLDGSILDAPSLLVGSGSATAIAGGLSHQALTATTFVTSTGVSQIAPRPITHGAPLGTACSSPASCGSGFCVDGVCCESACAGDGAADCAVCSTALGSSTNGQCQLISSCSIPPGTVQLFAPSGTILESNPTFSWQPLANAATYYLWVNDSAANRLQQIYTAADVGCESSVGTCSVTPGLSLLPGTGHFWVQASNAAGSGPWGTGMTFIVSGSSVPPSTPVLTAPSGSSTTTTPTYEWQASANATQYRFYVRDGAGLLLDTVQNASAVGCGSGGTCSFTPSSVVRPPSATWWVQAQNAAGASGWSLPLTFTVPTTPGAVVLLSPSGTASTMPTYTWQATSSATEYYLWVNDSTGNRVNQIYSANAVGCASTSTCSATPNVTLALGTGRWWVQARNAVGGGPWGAGVPVQIVP